MHRVCKVVSFALVHSLHLFLHLYGLRFVCVVSSCLSRRLDTSGLVCNKTGAERLHRAQLTLQLAKWTAEQVRTPLHSVACSTKGSCAHACACVYARMRTGSRTPFDYNARVRAVMRARL